MLFAIHIALIFSMEILNRFMRIWNRLGNSLLNRRFFFTKCNQKPDEKSALKLLTIPQLEIEHDALLYKYQNLSEL